MEKWADEETPAETSPAGEGGAGAGNVMGDDRAEHPPPSQEELAAMGDEIAQLAGQIAAAEARFLRLLGEFDVLGGWGGPGIRSLAHWLSWRAGMSLRTAQEHIRMARTLRDLPLTSAAFGAGELSFSKVRALTRVATPRTEESLVSIAKNATAAHVERIVAGLRKVSPDEPSPEDPEPGDPDPDEDQQPADPAAGVELRTAPPQRLRWRWDEQTDELVLWGRFGAADGKVILAALTRAELERIRTQQHREPGKEGQVNETGQREGSSETIPRPRGASRMPRIGPPRHPPTSAQRWSPSPRSACPSSRHRPMRQLPRSSICTAVICTRAVPWKLAGARAIASRGWSGLTRALPWTRPLAMRCSAARLPGA